MMNFKMICTWIALFLSSLSFSLTAQAADQLRVQLNWTADTAHLGFAMAKSKGLYERENLDVELIEGRGSAVAAQLVATGQVDLGYADAVAILKVSSQGAPIRIVSTIWKSGQFGIQSLKANNITTPQDLIGKKIAAAPASAQLPLVSVFLAANGIALDQVEIVSASENANLGLLTSGQVDAIAQTPEKIIVPLQQQGIEGSNMYFYDYGVPLVSLSLVANERTIAEKGDAIRRFNQATAEGWRMAMDHPEEAIGILMKTFPETENSAGALAVASTFSYASVCPVQGGIIGVTDDETWARMHEVMVLAMDLPAQKPVTDYYTNDLAPGKPVTCP